jgi:hypothetical protein
LAVLIVALANAGGFSTPADAGEETLIEKGFNLLYQLKFEEARRQFTDWQQENPKDPLSYEILAASYLFEEFYDQHVLTSEFFLNDERLLGGIQGKPNESRKINFEAANQKGQTIALAQLSVDPRNSNALFALTISTGMRANFAAILERRQLEGLSLIREAEGYARRLLRLRPEEADAWFSLGAANYIIGSLPPYKRFLLWFGQIRGNKQLGMEQLKITAEKGHYLKPFAQIFLALAAMREKQEDLALSQLLDLTAQFPENPLFQAELARLSCHCADSQHGGQ